MAVKEKFFEHLESYFHRVPAIQKWISVGYDDRDFWWVKFSIDIKNPLAWHVVQEFACVCNYLSINERLPTRFFPVSPAPYLNGGPQHFLSWVIEATDLDFTPALLAEWLEARLPRPVDDLSQWIIDEED